MNYQVLDMEHYNRKNHFEYFSSLPYPYVGVTVNVDITDFISSVKERNIPFFLSFCYCAAKSANSVPEFRQRIIDGGIVQFENCQTSHTVALDDGTYCYCTLDCNMPFQDYLSYAVQKQEDARTAKKTGDDPDEVDGLIFITTLPWLSYTNLVQPVPMPADSNPRISWGKYFKDGSKILIPVTVLCNHALVDGLHISQFYNNLNIQLSRI